MNAVKVECVTQASFAPFGDLLDCTGVPDRIINQGFCHRYHDRARLDFGPNGRAGVSLFNARPRPLPHMLEMVERHPEGSQCFIPMSQNPFLVTVALDEGGRPGLPRAFLTRPGQAVNYRRNTWHGVLTPLHAPGLFAVIDRIGGTPNLEEHWFDPPYQVTARSDF
ncbi:MAG: ureidoglycolate lyase [Pseudomonadota bacterium]